MNTSSPNICCGMENINQHSFTLLRYMYGYINKCLLSLSQIRMQRKWLKYTETMSRLCNDLVGMHWTLLHADCMSTTGHQSVVKWSSHLKTNTHLSSIAQNVRVRTMHDMQYKSDSWYCVWWDWHLFHIMAMLDWVNV